MNILFISKLTKKKWIGPNYSVPAQVKAQSQVDNCLWYNLKEHTFGDAGKAECLCLREVASRRLKDLPSPFDKPDLAILEGLYNFPFEKLVIDLLHNDIPYIIVPWSSMTDFAQDCKGLKKKLGNFIWFVHMVRSASAIQYLTKREMLESSRYSYKRAIIIPYGIDEHNEEWLGSGSEGIRGCFIGRIESHQKGFDILVEAMSRIQDVLRDSVWHLSVYGPDRFGSLEKLEESVERLEMGDIIDFPGPVYDDKKADILRRSDFFIMTSRYEGLPMGMIEALSFGVPCFATAGTNLADVIADADAGWTCASNVDGVSNTLLQMIEDRNLLKSKSKAARELSRRFSWGRIAEMSHQEFCNILSENKDVQIEIIA